VGSRLAGTAYYTLLRKNLLRLSTLSLHVVQGKGSADRTTLLSPTLLPPATGPPWAEVQ
jgi:hypothetical protein